VNFAGRGDHEWYRLVWISWRLWPLTRIQVPPGVEWRPPPEPAITDMEVAGAATVGAWTWVIVTMVAGGNPIAALGASLVTAPLGWVLGNQGRQWWRQRELERYGGTLMGE
jgi:hypothetical protein